MLIRVRRPEEVYRPLKEPEFWLHLKELPADNRQAVSKQRSCKASELLQSSQAWLDLRETKRGAVALFLTRQRRQAKGLAVKEAGFIQNRELVRRDPVL